jgi:amino acid transporter/predicted nucleotidyltransferase
VVVAGAGLGLVEWQRFSPENWPHLVNIVAGGMVIFLAYEGFELIANAAQDVEDPRILPKAFYAAVVTVITVYVLVAIVAGGVLSPEEVAKYRDYALAVAAEPSLGRLGFLLVTAAALASTSSAINATLYGTARISYIVARYGHLPPRVGRRVWGHAPEGLLIIALLSLFLVETASLEAISTAGSGGFLLVFTAVNVAAYRLRREAKVNPFIALTGAASTFASLLVLLYRMASIDVRQLSVFAALVLGSFLVEALYRSITGRRIAEYVDEKLRMREENIRHWEEWVPRFVRELKAHMREAEVYLVGSVARGELHRAHDVDLLVVTPRPPRSKEEARRIVEEARRAAGLTKLHPLDVHFATPGEKEKWLRHSGAGKRIEPNQRDQSHN